MRIDVLCADLEHPFVPTLATWVARQSKWDDARLIHDKSDFRDGDILFLVSCGQTIRAADRAVYRQTMVLHASNLPEGGAVSNDVGIVGGAVSRGLRLTG